MACSTADMQTLFTLLGLDPSASTHDIKAAYRHLSKKCHPDKNTSPESTALFQQLNHAYKTLMQQEPCDSSEPPAGDAHSDKLCLQHMINLSLHTKENTCSVTIDITDILFLVMLNECQHHHGVTPIERGRNGVQLRFPYSSPDDGEHYGSISLTFYPTTSRLLVQGSSYLLWVDEHLPIVYEAAERRYMDNVSMWSAETRRRGIGRKRPKQPSRTLRSSSGSKVLTPGCEVLTAQTQPQIAKPTLSECPQIAEIPTEMTPGSRSLPVTSTPLPPRPPHTHSCDATQLHCGDAEIMPHAPLLITEHLPHKHLS